MPPKRKGKKSAGNPGRGFATESIASKPRPAIPEAEAEPTESTTISSQPDKPVTKRSVQEAKDSTTVERDLSKLTPEELQDHLEEEELQLFVEKHADNVKREATRTASRIKAERRVLRGQAEVVNIRTWLPDDLQQQIFEQVLADQRTKKQDTSSLTDDALAKIWQLRQTLLRLDFMTDDIDNCLRWFTSSSWFAEEVSRSRTEGWAVNRCLCWLGLNLPPENLPDYSSHQNSALEKKLQQEEAERDAQLQSAEAAARQKSAEQVNAAASTVLETEAAASDDEVSEEDQDFDQDNPEHLIKKYIKLMTRLYHLKPELTEIERPNKKKGKFQVKLSKGPEVPRVQRLLNSIKALQADMLFDIDAALSLWFSQRQSLVIDAAQTAKPTNPPAKTQEAAIIAEEDSGDEFAGVGDLLIPLTDLTVISESVQTQTPVEAVKFRDFGKWSGTNPRRILEEACRSRDAAAKSSFRSIANSSHRRHAFEIKWSSPQDLHPSCPIPEITLAFSRLSAKLSMSTISTPDDSQAEAYIATIALFSLFSSSAKEEKSYIRLPPVWRSLYFELKEKEKINIEAADREEVKILRNLMQSDVHDEDGRDNALSQVAQPESHGGRQQHGTSQRDQLESDTLKQIWQLKASTSEFKDMLAFRTLLPMWTFKGALLTAVQSNQVTIIRGETGCGKSTQAPNFILENELSQGRDCRIYCTEPRRISAISLARRVSQELGEHRNDIGTARSLVGYSIRLESKISASTRLVFATTGVVMRMLEHDQQLEDITHLILDEVHERTIDGDFLLIILKRLMSKRPALKIILMSATVDAQRFSQYLGGAPILDVPGRTFPVEVKYLEDTIESLKYAEDTSMDTSVSAADEDSSVEEDNHGEGEPQSSNYLQGYSIKTRNVLKAYNEYKTNYNLIVQLLIAIATQPAYRAYSNAILVFLPGINEIRRLNNALVGHKVFNHGWRIFPLHSSIATEEQERAFEVPPSGVRKIVIATNIAETGITIPDVTCVVDTGTHKEMRYDERRQLSRLIETFISRANAKQRRGRAGRVQNGICFHLFTRLRHDKLMPEQQTPEIMRLSLQDLVLRVKICQMGNVEATLSEALDPPTAKNVRRAVDYLIDVKALTGNEDLTPLGTQLAKLPLDVFLGKLILLGSIFSCLDSCLSIAAILSSKSPFSAPMAAKSLADQAKMGFQKGDSDLLTVYNAYCAWRRICMSTGASEHEFCRKNYLSSQTLVNIEDLKGQLTSSLIEAGFLPADPALRSSLSKLRGHSRQRHFVELPKQHTFNDERLVVVNSVIEWSFYPKLLIKEGKGWRNISNNQAITLHPTSVNKTGVNGRFLSFYHLMQSASKSYNAHETSLAEDFAIILGSGDAEFKYYSGAVVLDSNKLRFSLPSWRSLILLEHLRQNMLQILTQKFEKPAHRLSERQSKWLSLVQKCLEEKDDSVDRRA